MQRIQTRAQVPGCSAILLTASVIVVTGQVPQLPPPLPGRGHAVGTMLCPDGPRPYVPVIFHRLDPTDRSKFVSTEEVGGTDPSGRWQARNLIPGEYVVLTWSFLNLVYSPSQRHTVKDGVVNDFGVLKDSGGEVSGCRPRRATVYVPVPPEVVGGMLTLADVTRADIVYDLGSGDGRIVIAAAQDFDARAVGIEFENKLVEEARDRVQKVGVANRVRIIEGDFFHASISDATVITLNLIPSVNRRLQPKLLKELKPGTRVVSYQFLMGSDWLPEQEIKVAGRTLFMWTIPKR